MWIRSNTHLLFFCRRASQVNFRFCHPKRVKSPGIWCFQTPRCPAPTPGPLNGNVQGAGSNLHPHRSTCQRASSRELGQHRTLAATMVTARFSSVRQLLLRLPRALHTRVSLTRSAPGETAGLGQGCALFLRLFTSHTCVESAASHHLKSHRDWAGGL